MLLVPLDQMVSPFQVVDGEKMIIINTRKTTSKHHQSLSIK